MATCSRTLMQGRARWKRHSPKRTGRFLSTYKRSNCTTIPIAVKFAAAPTHSRLHLAKLGEIPDPANFIAVRRRILLLSQPPDRRIIKTGIWRDYRAPVYLCQAPSAQRSARRSAAATQSGKQHLLLTNEPLDYHQVAHKISSSGHPPLRRQVQQHNHWSRIRTDKHM